MWYVCANGGQNGIGILVVKSKAQHLVGVKKCNDRIMLIRIVVSSRGRGYLNHKCVWTLSKIRRAREVRLLGQPR